MSEVLLAAILNSALKVGIDATVSLLDAMKNAKTIDDAIMALRAAQSKGWDDYVEEAKAKQP